jgi:hypothetical protein
MAGFISLLTNRALQPCLAAACAFTVLVSYANLARAGAPIDSQPTIQRLQAAQHTDYIEANDSVVSPQRQADFIAHAQMADLAIRKLRHGYSVPQEVIEEATEVPPKSVRAEKGKLLVELEETRQRQLMDEKLDYGDDEVGLDRLHLQEARTSEVIQNLNIDEFVPWTDVVRALGRTQLY